MTLCATPSPAMIRACYPDRGVLLQPLTGDSIIDHASLWQYKNVSFLNPRDSAYISNMQN